jgi:hypothetical protein
MEEPEKVIYAYTDEQALEDGMLIQVQGGKVNRVTRAVFDHFSQPLLNTPVGSLITDFTRVVKAIEFMSKLEADSDGWDWYVRRQGIVAGPERGRRTDAYVSRGLLNMVVADCLEPSRFNPYGFGWEFLVISKRRQAASFELGSRNEKGVPAPGGDRQARTPARLTARWLFQISSHD